MLIFYPIRQKLTAVCITAILTVMTGGAPAYAQQTGDRIMAVGSSAIQENAASAREKAVADALRTALEQTAVGLLPPKDLAENFSSLVRTVFSNPDRFVETFKVVTEVGLAKSYEVLVEAVVSKELILQAMSTAGIAPGEKGTVPKVLVVLIEKELDGTEPPAWIGGDAKFYQSAAENSVKSALKQKQIEIVGQDSGSENLENVVIPFTPDYNLQQVLEIGGRLGADIVAVGRASAEIVPNVMQGNLKSYKGSVRMEAFRVDTGQKIGESEEISVITHTEERLAGPEVLKAAGQAAGRRLAEQIGSQWRNAAEPVWFEMVVEGTRQLVNFVQFRRMIEALPAVKNVLTKEMKPDQAVLSVEVAGGPKKLADAIMVESFDSFGVDISTISDSRMKVTLVPR